MSTNFILQLNQDFIDSLIISNRIFRRFSRSSEPLSYLSFRGSLWEMLWCFSDDSPRKLLQFVELSRFFWILPLSLFVPFFSLTRRYYFDLFFVIIDQTLSICLYSSPPPPTVKVLRGLDLQFREYLVRVLEIPFVNFQDYLEIVLGVFLDSYHLFCFVIAVVVVGKEGSCETVTRKNPLGLRTDLSGRSEWFSIYRRIPTTLFKFFSTISGY